MLRTSFTVPGSEILRSSKLELTAAHHIMSIRHGWHDHEDLASTGDFILNFPLGNLWPLNSGVFFLSMIWAIQVDWRRNVNIFVF